MLSAPIFSADDADWLAHRHVESDDAIRFIHVPRAERGEVSFLTDANLGDRTGGAVDLPVRQCLSAFQSPQICWLFHSAFCGSTLLTRALDLPGVASSLSEPVLLNDVVGLRRRGALPRDVARLADAAIRMLARPYLGDKAVVIKPSNVVNPLAELLLTLQPSAPAVFLFAPLETFLISVARKGLQCRLWVRELLEGYLREDFVALGFTPGDYFRQSDLQVAAVGWLAQHAHFARLSSKLGPQRIATLDADAMMMRPAAAIDAVARQFGLGLTDAEVDAIAQGRSFNRHSKSGGAYSAEARQADYAAARSSHGEEIDTVMLWATRVAEAAGVAMNPPNMLMPQAV